MRIPALAVFAIIGLAVAAPASADVHITLQNGRVSIDAKDATLREILAEWAKVGQTKIVNGERVPGGPVTLQLIDVSEAEALEVLLRPLSGYMAAPRAVDVANLSRFDRIVVMPTPAPPPTAARTAPPSPVFPQAGQPTFATAPQPMEDEQEGVAVPNGNRGPVFNTFPQPQVVNPPAAMPSATPGFVVQPQVPAQPQPQVPNAQPAPVYPGMPTAPSGGVAVPGMIVPAPQQPGQQQGQPVQAAPVQPPPKRPGPGGTL